MWFKKKTDASHTDTVVTRIEKESNEVMSQVERLQKITERIKQNRQGLEVMPNDR